MYNLWTIYIHPFPNDDEDIQMVIWLLRLDKSLLSHKLSDGSSCKDRLMQLNAYEIVISKLS